MPFQPGDFVRAVHPDTKRMVMVLVTAVRGKILEYHVSDGVTEWWTFIVRKTLEHGRRRRRKK